MFSVDRITLEQSNIIRYPLDRDLYIEAPAGHGKTSTAILKAADLAKKLVESPHQQVLILTFSKMAVRQIDYEKQQNVPKHLHSKILIRTYHSFYYDLICQYARYLGFRHTNFGLLTNEEREALYLLFTVSNPGLDYEHFSCAQYIAANICPPKPIEGAYSIQLINEANTFLNTYHRQEHRLGFDDYPYYAYRIMSDSAFVCDLLAYKYPVVFLDEFQNTNDLQWTILQCFISNVKLVVFADPSQTIHGFRGAGQGIDKYKQERNPEIIPLTSNFRNSTSLYQFAKGIATGRFDAPPPENVTFHKLEIYNKDKWNLKFDILRLMGSPNPPIRSIAILTKKNNDVTQISDLLGQETEKTPYIPHEVVFENFTDQNQENVILALLQLITTCDLRYLIVFASTLTACSTGNANYLFYCGQAIEQGQCSPDILSNQNNVPGIQNARAVLSIIKPVIEIGVPEDLNLAWQRVEHVLNGLDKIRSIPNLSKAYTRVRIEWDNLINRDAVPSLETYMYHMMAQRKRKNFLEQRSYLRGSFVMTLHQSQGKQFDAVLIWHCNDGIIPHPDEIRNGDTSPSQNLLYVGITRARHIVRIYYEQNQYVQPSRLIKPFLI